MEEIWNPVLGYEDTYEISNAGNLRRYRNRFGNISLRPCRPGYSRGYARFTLSQEAETQTISGHKLVWEAFVAPVPAGLQINHKNGVKDDNRLANLEVVSPALNTRHAHEVLGYRPKPPPHVPGSRNGRATITESDVPVIRALYAAGATQKEIAHRFGMKVGAVGCLVRGETWTHVTSF